MSRSGKGYEIGRGRPPKATQWKKGKSANPGGRSSPRPIGLFEMIDKLLLTSVKITRDGESKWVTTLEAILRSLWRGRPLWPAATSPPVSKSKCDNGGKREQEHFSGENKGLSSNCDHGDLQGRRE
jgi:hypothetical protein